MANPGNRIVVLIDMDCFFCQVETKLQPQHAGKPLAVVQYNQWEMGGIIAVNYEARSFGVTRHMRGKEAKEKCPDIILASVPCLRGKADTTRYRKAGCEVIEVMKKHCNLIERASVDEAYLDITDIVDKKLASEISPKELISSLANTYIVGYSEIGKNDEEQRRQGLKTWILDSFNELHDTQTQKLAIAGVIVEEIRANIYKETKYRCSAGIAQNKILAKLACGLHKPNCQTILPEAAISNLYSTMPVKKIRNLGGKLGDVVIESLGCKVMGDLLQYSLEQLQKLFDEKTGLWLYNIARGVDNEPVTNRLLPKSVGACKKFPGKQAITSLEVLKHWAGDLAAEVCERLEQDLIDNQRRATLLTVSYHYYQNRNTISQSRSLTLNSYKSEKMASQCVDVITKSTQCPVSYMGIIASKFVPSKESGTFLKFFKDTKTIDNGEIDPKIDKSETSNSLEDTSSSSILNFETKGKEKPPDAIISKKDGLSKTDEKKFFTIDTSKEDSLLQTEEEEVIVIDEKDSLHDINSILVKKSIPTNSEAIMKGNKRIIDNSLSINTDNSPTSRRVFKLMQVCNERDKAKCKDKRMSGIAINSNDFQSSFFMNVYKTDRKDYSNNIDVIESVDIVEESEHAEQLIITGTKNLTTYNEDTNDCSTGLYMQENNHEMPSTSRTHSDCEDSSVKKSNVKEICAQNPAVRLREIFPNMDDIDPDILLLLPDDLQKEAKSYVKTCEKRENVIKVTRDLPKMARGRPSKSKIADKKKKRSPLLYNFLIKTDPSKHDVPLERCAECDQMIPLTRYDEHTDFHVAQNLFQEINKPTVSGENGVKRKLRDAEVIVTSTKR